MISIDTKQKLLDLWLIIYIRPSRDAFVAYLPNMDIDDHLSLRALSYAIENSCTISVLDSASLAEMKQSKQVFVESGCADSYVLLLIARLRKDFCVCEVYK